MTRGTVRLGLQAGFEAIDQEGEAPQVLLGRGGVPSPSPQAEVAGDHFGEDVEVGAQIGELFEIVFDVRGRVGADRVFLVDVDHLHQRGPTELVDRQVVRDPGARPFAPSDLECLEDPLQASLVLAREVGQMVGNRQHRRPSFRGIIGLLTDQRLSSRICSSRLRSFWRTRSTVRSDRPTSSAIWTGRRPSRASSTI